MGKAKGSFLLCSSAAVLGSVQMQGLGRAWRRGTDARPVGSGDGITRQLDKVQVQMLPLALGGCGPLCNGFPLFHYPWDLLGENFGVFQNFLDPWGSPTSPSTPFRQDLSFPFHWWGPPCHPHGRCHPGEGDTLWTPVSLTCLNVLCWIGKLLYRMCLTYNVV